MKAILTVPHEFDMLVKSGHIQGLACSEKGIYLSHAPAHLGGIASASSSTPSTARRSPTLPSRDPELPPVEGLKSPLEGLNTLDTHGLFNVAFTNTGGYVIVLGQLQKG